MKKARKAVKKAPRKRGKPEYQPTAANRKKVRTYAAGGISEEVMAELLKISRNTLRKYYAHELSHGHQLERANNIDRLNKAADKGNVGAIKFLEAIYGPVSASKSFTDAPSSEKSKAAATPRAPKLGKKEIADQVAETAGVGSPWGADLLPPGTKAN